MLLPCVGSILTPHLNYTIYCLIKRWPLYAMELKTLHVSCLSSGDFPVATEWESYYRIRDAPGSLAHINACLAISVLAYYTSDPHWFCASTAHVCKCTLTLITNPESNVDRQRPLMFYPCLLGQSDSHVNKHICSYMFIYLSLSLSGPESSYFN